jgi:hypothetical protein
MSNFWRAVSATFFFSKHNSRGICSTENGNRKTFQGSHSWALGTPVNHEKLELAGGTAFPGCARPTCFLDTGWKACVTDAKNFLEKENRCLPGSRASRSNKLRIMGSFAMISQDIFGTGEIRRENSPSGIF